MNYNDFKFNATIESRLDNYNLSIINLPFLPKKINKFIDLSEGEYIIKNKLVFVDKNNNINNHIFNPGSFVANNNKIAGFVDPSGTKVISVDKILKKFNYYNIKSQNGGFSCTNTALNNQCLKVGNQAPLFKADAVLNEKFFEINLKDYLGQWVVLFFYPLDFTFVCPTEITAFSDSYYKFNELNCEIIGVSVDSKYSHLKWLQTNRSDGGIGQINYPLVSDLKKDISRSYNVLNINGEADRALFIINPSGTVVHATINKAPVGRNVKEVLRILQAFQHVEQNKGCVCPVNWTPGDKHIIEDPVKSKEYFLSLD